MSLRANVRPGGWRSIPAGVALALAVVAFPAHAQVEPPAAPAPEAGKAERAWSLRASVLTYVFPDGTAYASPVAAFDMGGLHLEGRYNYEAKRTGSLWVGWNLGWGEEVHLALTPMVGGIFGDLNGIAPGLEWSLSWGPLELYAENEFVFDLADVEQSYFYVWGELSASPFDWLRAGLALQRTRAHASSREVQWGALLGVSAWKLSATGYWFNPGQPDAQYWVVAVGIEI
jgi:hypothetical protein